MFRAAGFQPERRTGTPASSDGKGPPAVSKTLEKDGERLRRAAMSRQTVRTPFRCDGRMDRPGVVRVASAKPFPSQADR
ncbi:MAG: hypothetical protein D6788_06350 [Planctomycetota bacterium]|nr:MAG: hypothetical protein D6788_06350 [Planctomycetota bacterium]